MRQEPDDTPGNYYVTVRRDDGDFRALVGPFVNDHAGALAMVARATEMACRLDPKAHWYAYGTARLATDRPGILNARLGVLV